MAQSNWKVTIYAATTDTASTAYDTVATSNIAALGTTYSYTTAEFYITGSRATWEIESASLEDISGSRRGTSSRRRVFEIESFPFAFANGAGSQRSSTRVRSYGRASKRAREPIRARQQRRTQSSSTAGRNPSTTKPEHDALPCHSLIGLSYEYLPLLT
jgi:hypothetical protein